MDSRSSPHIWRDSRPISTCRRNKTSLVWVLLMLLLLLVVVVVVVVVECVFV